MSLCVCVCVVSGGRVRGVCGGCVCGVCVCVADCVCGLVCVRVGGGRGVVVCVGARVRVCVGEVCVDVRVAMFVCCVCVCTKLSIQRSNQTPGAQTTEDKSAPNSGTEWRREYPYAQNTYIYNLRNSMIAPKHKQHT